MKLKYISDPDELLRYFADYITETKDKPRLQNDYVGKDATEVNRKLERPLTFIGFEAWLSNNEVISSLQDYEQNRNNAYTDYAEAITRIKKVIEADCVEGAIVGMYNANIISRLLGLADKKEVKVETYDVTLNLT